MSEREASREGAAREAEMKKGMGLRFIDSDAEASCWSLSFLHGPFSVKLDHEEIS